MDTKGFLVLTLLVLASALTVSLGQGIGSICAEYGPFCNPQLTCKNGTCDCRYTWQIFDTQQRQCVSPVGGFCNGDGSLTCTPNSQCSSKETAFKDYLGFCFCNAPYETVSGFSCDDSSKAEITDPVNSPPLICCPTTNAQNRL